MAFNGWRGCERQCDCRPHHNFVCIREATPPSGPGLAGLMASERSAPPLAEAVWARTHGFLKKIRVTTCFLGQHSWSMNNMYMGSRQPCQEVTIQSFCSLARQPTLPNNLSKQPIMTLYTHVKMVSCTSNRLITQRFQYRPGIKSAGFNTCPMCPRFGLTKLVWWFYINQVLAES